MCREKLYRLFIPTSWTITFAGCVMKHTVNYKRKKICIWEDFCPLLGRMKDVCGTFTLFINIFNVKCKLRDCETCEI